MEYTHLIITESYQKSGNEFPLLFPSTSEMYILAKSVKHLYTQYKKITAETKTQQQQTISHFYSIYTEPCFVCKLFIIEVNEPHVPN